VSGTDYFNGAKNSSTYATTFEAMQHALGQARKMRALR
jgi:hypothetical protein